MQTHAHHRRFGRRSRLLAAGVVLAACTLPHQELDAESTTSALQDVRGVDDLRDRFNRDAGHVRLVLLLSPT